MSAPDPFERLAPFIQKYIYQQRWADLRDVQKAAIPAILDSSDHVLIMSGTASGKTEAALLPVLTLLEQAPAQSVGVLYIGPLKALINDQFERIEGLLQEKPEIPIQGWHADIASSRKERFLRQAAGILQITPESMEALLINHAGELPRIFGDLRFVIIDEIHAFLGTERGQQVLCQLQRLEGTLRRSVRRIGLSATIGDTDLALRWLESSAQFQTRARLVAESSQGRHIQLRVNHFVMATEKGEPRAAQAAVESARRQREAPVGTSTSEEQERSEDEEAPEDLSEKRWKLRQEDKDYYDDLFATTRSRQKTLIFTNRRNRAERIAAEMRQRLAQEQPGTDWYFVHHSSIAASLREEAEARMRDSDRQACIIATASLELGIDIGHLDLVAQIDAPHTVSSFIQRLGRSGRRGTPSRMCFYTFEYLDPEIPDPPLLEQIPWNFLQTVAIVQLYLDERWIEPPDIPTMPLSLLYQQTMSVMQAHTELTPSQLAQRILTLTPFQSITLEEYRLFLRHLVALDQLAQMDEGTLIVGMKGEQITNFYHFYAIFASEQDCRVLAGTQEIGTLQRSPEVNSIIGLAGYAWRVISVDERGKTAHVERAKGAARPGWVTLGDVHFHARVMERLRQVLQEETMYTYLSPLAQQRLALVRELVRQADWLQSRVAPLAPGRFVVFVWTSSRIYQTLIDLFVYLDWYAPHTRSGYYIEITHQDDTATVLAELRALSPQVPELVKALVATHKDTQLWQGKYDHLTPRGLLEKAYINDVLDIPGTMEWLATCL